MEWTATNVMTQYDEYERVEQAKELALVIE